MRASVKPAVAIQELLRAAKWCFVQFFAALYQAEVPAELAVKRFGVIAHHVKPAAFRRSFWSECADNHVATRLNGAGNLPNVGKTSIVLGRRARRTSSGLTRPKPSTRRYVTVAPSRSRKRQGFITAGCSTRVVTM